MNDNKELPNSLLLNNNLSDNIDNADLGNGVSNNRIKIATVIFIGILIIAIILLSYYLYDYYTKNDSSIKIINDLQIQQIALKKKLIEINDNIIKLDNVKTISDNKDTIDTLSNNINKLIEEYNKLKSNISANNNKLFNLSGDLQSLKSKLINLQSDIKFKSSIDKSYFNINNSDIDDIITNLVIMINNATSQRKDLEMKLGPNDKSLTQEQVKIIVDRLTTLAPVARITVYPNPTNNTLINDSITSLEELMNSINTKFSNIKKTNDDKSIDDISKLIFTSYLGRSVKEDLDIILNSQSNKINELITQNNILKSQLYSLLSFDPTTNINIVSNDTILNRDFSILNQQSIQPTQTTPNITQSTQSAQSIQLTQSTQATPNIIQATQATQATPNISQNRFQPVNEIILPNEYIIIPNQQGFSNPPTSADIDYLKNYLKVSKYTLDILRKKINNIGASNIDTTSKFTTANDILSAIDQKITAYTNLQNQNTSLTSTNTSLTSTNTTLNDKYNKLSGKIITVVNDDNLSNNSTNRSRIPLNKLHGFIFLNRSISGNDTAPVLGGNRLLSIGDCLNNTPSCYAYTNSEFGNYLKRSKNFTGVYTDDLLSLANNNIPTLINNEYVNNNVRSTFINNGDIINSIGSIYDSSIISPIIDSSDNTIKYFNNYKVLKHIIITNATIVDEGNIDYIDATKNQAYFLSPSGNALKTNNCIANVSTGGILDSSYNADGALLGQYNGSVDYSSGPWCNKIKIKSGNTNLIKLKKSPANAVYIYNPLSFDYSQL